MVDDTPSIHSDFHKLLGNTHKGKSAGSGELEALGATLFGRPSTMAAPPSAPVQYQVDSALQGRDALAMVVRQQRAGHPYALAFVDMRMPPGWDGVETIEHLLEADPSLEVVICSAYSDYSWHEVISRVKRPGLRLLQKPFQAKEVLDLAYTLTTRWARARGGGSSFPPRTP